MKQLFTFFVLIIPFFTFAQTVPDFTVTTSDGDTFSLYADALDQGKTVMIKFFFVTCPPCKSIAPYTETLYQEWGAGEHDVEFISLSVLSSNDNSDVATFKNTYGTTYPGAGNDGGGYAACQPYLNGDFGGFGGTPTFAVIAPDGTVNFNVRATSSGYTAWIAALDAAIAATGASKPNNTTPTNYTANGTVFNANGTVAHTDETLILATTEAGTQTINQNPFSIADIPENSNLTIEVQAPDTNPTHGVTTHDLVLINQHVLGIKEFTETYEYIAADVNGDGIVSTFDVVLLRQLILFIIPELPINQNWIVYNTSPLNISPSTVGDTRSIMGLDNNLSGLNFTLLKMGDVSGDAYE